MDKWVEIATKLGLPVVVAGLIGWFLGSKVWPWMVAQVEKAQDAREKDLDRFSTQVQDVAKEQTKAVQALSDDIRSWRRDRER